MFLVRFNCETLIDEDREYKKVAARSLSWTSTLRIEGTVFIFLITYICH